MKQFTKIVILICFICLLAAYLPSTAQDSASCPAIIQTALKATNDACQDTGRNQACYGNVKLVLTPQANVGKFRFEQRGDTMNIAQIQNLSLTPMNTTTGEWGVALMRVQANLPDTLPGQNVTFLLFGDVEIENAVSAQSDLKPMQAFYFQSGVGDAPCAEAPNSGILIQTPKGAGAIELTINGADIVLGSTAYLQAQPGKTMTVAVVEGQAEVSAKGTTQTVPAGAQVNIPLDSNRKASGAPSKPEPYTTQQVQALPVSLLERPITVAPPLTAQTTATPSVCTLSASTSVNLRNGPGTVYPKAGSLAAGDSTVSNGQAKGTDGLTWWRLPGDKWVRSDVVQAAGDCAGVPVETHIPSVPTPAPTTVHPGRSVATVTLHPWGCEPTTVPVGTITLQFGVGRWATREEAEAHIGNGMATLSVNGQSPVNYRRWGYSIHTGYGDPGWGDTTLADITLELGVYTYSGEWIDGPRSCTITVTAQ